MGGGFLSVGACRPGELQHAVAGGPIPPLPVTMEPGTPIGGQAPHMWHLCVVSAGCLERKEVRRERERAEMGEEEATSAYLRADGDIVNGSACGPVAEGRVLLPPPPSLYLLRARELAAVANWGRQGLLAAAANREWRDCSGNPRSRICV